jgi:hypothetical protein
MAVIYGSSNQARVFVLGKTFQLNLIYEVKARSGALE